MLYVDVCLPYDTERVLSLLLRYDFQYFHLPIVPVHSHARRPEQRPKQHGSQRRPWPLSVLLPHMRAPGSEGHAEERSNKYQRGLDLDSHGGMVAPLAERTWCLRVPRILSNLEGRC